MTTTPTMNSDRAFHPATLLELVAAVLLPTLDLGDGLRPNGEQRAGEHDGQPFLRVGLQQADGTPEGHLLLVLGESDPDHDDAVSDTEGIDDEGDPVRPAEEVISALPALERRCGLLRLVEEPSSSDTLEHLRLGDTTRWARPTVEATLLARIGDHPVWSAWLSQVDVLQTMPAADRLRALLEVELIADGRVGFSAVGSGEAKRRPPLAQVFCDLPVQLRASTALSHLDQELRQADTFIRWALGVVGAAPQLAPRAPAPQVTVLIGGPGQGKTTLGVYLCQLHRAALLGLAPAGLSDAGKLELEALAGQAAGLRARLLPFRVVLHRFADALAGGEVPDLWAWLALDANRRLRVPDDGRAVNAAAVKGWWAGRAVLLVLDGLDEVPASGNRAAVLAAIQALLAEAEGMGAVVQVIATTRPQGYQGELSRQGATEAALTRLDAPLAQAYAHKLLAVWLAEDGAREHEVKTRVGRALAAPAVAALAVSPLQVMLITLLVEQSGQVPRDRWRLFSEVYRLLFNRERERGIASVRVLHEHPRLVDELHEEVGYLLHLEAERASGASARLPRPAFEALVDQVLDGQGFVSDERAAVRAQVIEASMERLVFLVANEADGAISFEVRMLQEHCAARRLLSGPEDKLLGRLEAIIGLAHWYEVWGMAVNVLIADKRHLAPEIARLAVALDRRDAPSAAARRGPRTVASLLMDPGVRAHPKLRATLVSHAVQWLRPVEPGLDGETAGALVIALLHADSRALVGLVEERGRSWPLNHTAWNVLVESHIEDPEATAWPLIALMRGIAPIDAQPPIKIIARCKRDDRTDYRDLPVSKWLREGGWLALPVGSSVLFFGNGDYVYLSRQWVAGYEYKIRATLADHRVYIRLGQASGSELPEPPPPWRHRTHWWMSLFWAYQQGASLIEIARLLVSRWSERPAMSELPAGTPWPLGAVLCWSDSPDALLEGLAKTPVGTTADWSAADERWRTKGITDQDWHTPSTGLPSPALALKGCPPWVRTLERRRFPTSKNRRGEQRALYPALQLETVIRAQEAGIGDGLLPIYTRSQPRSSTFANEWILRRIRSPAFQYQSDLNRLRLSQDALLRATALAGELYDDVHRRHIGTLVNASFPHFKALQYVESGMFGLLPTLAMCAAENRLPPTYPPFDLTIQTAPRLRAAAITLNIALGPGPTASESATFARDLLNTDDYLDEQLSIVLNRWSPQECEELLCTLLEGHDHPAPNLRRALADRLARRHTTLQDPRVAEALDLPCPPSRPDALADAPAPSVEPVQLADIEINDLRGIRSLRLTRSASPEQGQWTFLIGENASGKTTVLRAIALALAGADAARALLAQHAGPPVRASCAKATVTLSLHGRPPIALTVRAPKSTDDFDAPDIFVVGYGPRRGTVLGKEARRVALEPGRSLFTLFEENAELIHAETWLTQLYSRWKADDQNEEAFFHAVIRLLVALLPEVEAIDVNATSVVVTERGVQVPLDSVSDGYLTTAGWLLDLIARWAERERRAKRPLTADFARRMTGLVLIDELDLHLHPRWQWGLVEALRETFPALSFFVTTHNPMTVLGARGDEVVVLRRVGDGLTAVPVDLSAGTNAADLLTGPVFGMPSIVDRDTLRQLDKQRALLQIAPEGDEARALAEQLAPRLGQRDPGPLEQIAQRAVAEVLREEVHAMSPDQREAARQRALARLRERPKGGA